jgi:hypothetical protein
MRKSGLFVRKCLSIKDIMVIKAISRDAVTHDEIFIVFIDKNKKELISSEFDDGFREVIKFISTIFKGVENWSSVAPDKPFTENGIILWP